MKLVHVKLIFVSLLLSGLGCGSNDGPPREPIILVTSGQQAAESGLEVLAEGGSATDAALAVALAQIALTGGNWNSFAGILGGLYYDARSGEIHALHAGYRTFSGENDPLTIPTYGTPSGRTALVPGFMAGVEAAHQRFGRLPWQRLFEPAIAIAEDGFEVSELLALLFDRRKDVLTRLPETRAIYAPNGSMPGAGEIFRQPALATTLRAVASEGADYMYTGPWAQRFVAQVSAEGGRVTAQDLASYEVVWNQPSCFDHRENAVCTLSPPDAGGVSLAESLLVLEAAGVAEMGSYVESPDALFWLVKAIQVGFVMPTIGNLSPEDPAYLTDRLDGVELDTESRLSSEQAGALVGHIESGKFDEVLAEWYGTIGARSTHSDAIVVVDRDGNIVALTHTINTDTWGTTGINVDGVSIPDSAAFQQGAVALAGAGQYMPNPLNPTLVSRDGDVHLATTTIGNVHYSGLLRLHGVLDLGKTPAEVVDMPLITGYPYAEVYWPPDAFSPSALDALAARGVSLQAAANANNFYWLGTSIDPASGATDGAASHVLDVIGGGAYSP